MDAMEKEIERNPPDAFVASSLAANATQETLTLNLVHRLVNRTIDLESVGVIEKFCTGSSAT